ncbi:MAG: hypothetical protein WBA99_08755 [Nodosilinea sp.]
MASSAFVSRSVAAAIATLGLFCLAPAALAQSTTGTDPASTPRVDPNEGFGNTDANSGLFGENASPFELIHRAVLMNDRSPSDFRRQHRGRMSDEASSFRTRQQDALRRQQVTPTAAPEVVAPATGEE